MSILPKELPHFVPDNRFTLEQYLAIEQSTGLRYEYHDGQLLSVEMMAGGSHNHSRLAANAITLSNIGIFAAEDHESRLVDCDGHTSDLRIAVDGGKRYLYADAVIVCGEPLHDPFIPSAITNPVTVFEVLSPSSEGYDRGLKFDFYGQLASVREYVIIDQDRRRVEVRHRGDASSPWAYAITTAEAGEVHLPSMGFALPMERLYRNWAVPA